MPPVAPKIGFVSLGCPKALVDSERIISQLRAEGYALSPDYAGADLVVVNTCGFIDAAVQESLQAIGEAVQENGRVIVTGCLGVRDSQVREAHPQVLAVTGPHAYEEVMQAVHRHEPPPHEPFTSLLPAQGIRLTPRHYAYLKISEGCNHRCSFCIIPSMRGDLVSRPVEDVLREAENLAAAGVQELLVIAQDTSAYGVDIKYRGGLWRGRPVKSRLRDLAAALGELGIWVRLHYVYPYPHVDDVIPLMAAGRLLPYLDMPLQHGSARVLRAMRRPAATAKVLDRIAAWRREVPQLTLRSTFIVGFPGETEAEFEELLGFLREAQLDRVGCFRYSAVDGAAANALPGAVDEQIKLEREARFMAVQEQISAARLARYVGRQLRVLVDQVDGDVAVARGPGDAPEIDGVVYVSAADDVSSGDFLDVTVTATEAHDMHAIRTAQSHTAADNPEQRASAAIGRTVRGSKR